jgi:hypothetical protein
MDLLVTPLLSLIVPHLPALLMKATEAVVGEAAKKTAFEAVPSGVKAIWAKLWPKVEADPGVAAAADSVAAEPQDKNSQMVLKLTLNRLLENLAKTEPELVEELEKLLKAAQAESPSSGSNSGTVTAKTIFSSVIGDGAAVTMTFGVPPQE